MRLVGSMTTLPDRINNLIPTIKSVLYQSEPLDILYINLPIKTLKNKSYIIPDLFLHNFKGLYTEIIINRCSKDFGPITKLAPVLDIETDNNTYIFTFDDDMIYHRNAVKKLKEKIKQYPYSCLCFSGVCCGSFPFYYQAAINNKKDCLVDWIEGVHICVYRRSFFEKCDELISFGDDLPIRECLLMNDDHKISVYLANKNIDRISIGAKTTDYIFKGPYTYENSLSSRLLTLWMEHYRIIKYFMNIGLYNKQYKITRSIGFSVIFILFLIIIMLKSNEYYVKIFCVLTIILFMKTYISDTIDKKQF